MKLPKAESLILLAFLICMALWAMSKCSARRADTVRQVRDLEDTVPEERPARRDTIAVQAAPQIQALPSPAPPVTQAPQTTVPAPKPGAAPKRPTLTNELSKPTPKPSGSTSSGTSGSTLFVTIDGLKVRKEPGLKGETLAELKLYEPVTFLNKKTDWTQEISLGYEKVTDHWVKIRTAAGKEGWVFGAGLHYYKMKRQGVLEQKAPAEGSPKKQR
jgi:hypothetical protein